MKRSWSGFQGNLKIDLKVSPKNWKSVVKHFTKLCKSSIGVGYGAASCFDLGKPIEVESLLFRDLNKYWKALWTRPRRRRHRETGKLGNGSHSRPSSSRHSFFLSCQPSPSFNLVPPPPESDQSYPLIKGDNIPRVRKTLSPTKSPKIDFDLSARFGQPPTSTPQKKKQSRGSCWLVFPRTRNSGGRRQSAS